MRRCGTRSDCGAKFRFTVQLLDENKHEVDKFDREKAMEDNLGKWHLIEHVFQDYKPGVRYIRVELGGVDTKFWKGNFGSKFTMPTVRFVFNKA
nr:hypothetical protein BaRGS_020741 [Batillaria attramentaria]